MAQYEREFLVPYVEDICALYMCENVLVREVNKTRREINEITAQPAIRGPERPVCEEPWEKNKGKVIWSIIVILAAIWIISTDPGYGGPLERMGREVINIASGLAAVVSVIVMIASIADASSTKRFNDSVWAEYEEEVSIFKIKWNAAMTAKEKKRREVLPYVEAENKKYSNDLKECRNLRRKLYSADVIPTKYRNEYAVMYLYDWFKHNRRADDMDLALNTFVLEQIKDRLDKMIMQLEEVIINQRIMIANQRQSMEEQRQHYAYMEQMARTAVANQEEQTQYLEMLDSKLAVDNFFNAANYLRKK